MSANMQCEQRRPRVPSADATLSAYERDRDRAGFLLAGALAYRLFLWLLPFTLLIVGALGFLEASDQDNPSDLADNLGVVGLASKSVSEAGAGLAPGEPRRAQGVPGWLLPRPSVHWTAVLPGAITIGLGLQAIHLVNVYFISYRISTSSETYGALGAAAAILLSLFLIGRLFVAGVILNATLWERQNTRDNEATGGQSPNRGDAT
jgi:uncharacterized BrkB/YihY/UPF0761 family membrane protein